MNKFFNSINFIRLKKWGGFGRLNFIYPAIDFWFDCLVLGGAIFFGKLAGKFAPQSLFECSFMAYLKIHF